MRSCLDVDLDQCEVKLLRQCVLYASDREEEADKIMLSSIMIGRVGLVTWMEGLRGGGGPPFWRGCEP